MARLKMTGFGRFIIFLLIISPIVYFGARYLKNSGLLEVNKEETVTSPEDINAELPSENEILEEISRKSDEDYRNKREEEIIAEQQRKIEELERQNRDLRDQKSDQTTQRTPIPPTTTTQSNEKRDGPSFDDILREAEDVFRDKGASTGSTTTSEEPAARSSATWTFAFNGISGEIELYEQSGRIMARTVYGRDNRVDVSELVAQGDRLMVKNSPTGEYYTLRSDGDLDAYDQSGYLTTCQRKS
ncbi:MAG: hypothetical protein KJP00_03760 [Bacteroidia bacterium]|nr:hypothetical protein [Bacteroidia bacterium]